MGETTETEREIVATFSARFGMDKKNKGAAACLLGLFLGSLSNVVAVAVAVLRLCAS